MLCLCNVFQTATRLGLGRHMCTWRKRCASRKPERTPWAFPCGSAICTSYIFRNVTAPKVAKGRLVQCVIILEAGSVVSIRWHDSSTQSTVVQQAEATS